jgi:hypothetical protein
MSKFSPPPTSQKEFKVLPPGNYVARCVSFIDLLTQSMEWQGEEKSMRKVRLTFETPTELVVFNEDKGEQPYLVSKEFTLSFHEKATLRKMLEGLIKDFDPNKFDPEKDLIGKACMVNITNEMATSGRLFAKIMAITPLPRGMECPEQVTQSTYFFTGYSGMNADFDRAVFETLPKFIQEKIALSPEYKELFGDNLTPEQKEQKAGKKKDASDLPF